MPSFKVRSDQLELLDGEAIPFAAIQQNMAELNRINHLLGGHRITLKGVKALVKEKAHKEWHIVEVGCGGGDNLRVIKNWATKNNIKIVLTGIDINEACISYAQEVNADLDIHFMVSDYRCVSFTVLPDIIFSSLFCHHFNEQELVSQLQWMHTNAKVGFFINDLHRHPLAYYSIKLLTQLFSKSYLVKNDAPISVLRGFKEQEWKHIFQLAKLPLVQWQWCWAFRWLIVCHK